VETPQFFQKKTPDNFLENSKTPLIKNFRKKSKKTAINLEKKAL
jgi:hypothetical protein